MSPNKIDAVDAILLALSAMLATPTTPVYEPKIFFWRRDGERCHDHGPRSRRCSCR